MKFSYYLKQDGTGGIFIGAMIAAIVLLGFLMISIGYKNRIVMTVISFIYIVLWLAYIVTSFVRHDKTMFKTAALILGVSLIAYLATMGALENMPEILNAALYELFLMLSSVLAVPVLLTSGLPYLSTMYKPMLIPLLIFIISATYLIICKYKSRERE